MAQTEQNERLTGALPDAKSTPQESELMHLDESFSLEQEKFRSSPAYLEALRTLSRLSPVDSVVRIALTIQSSFLFKHEGISDPQITRELGRLRTEFGARVGVTMLREDPSELSYQRGNLQAWLGEKGIIAEVDENHKGEDVLFAGGVNVGDSLLTSEQINPAGAVVLINQLRDRIDSLTANETVDKNIDLLVVVSKVTQLIREEIEAAVLHKEVPQARYVDMLKDYLAAIGIRITIQPSESERIRE